MWNAYSPDAHGVSEHNEFGRLKKKVCVWQGGGLRQIWTKFFHLPWYLKEGKSEIMEKRDEQISRCRYSFTFKWKIAHERRKKDTFKIVSSLSFEMQKNNLLYVI